MKIISGGDSAALALVQDDQEGMDLGQWFASRNEVEPLDLDEYPPETNLIEYFGPERSMVFRAIPWQQFGKSTIILCDERTDQEMVREEFHNRTKDIIFIDVGADAIDRLIGSTIEPLLITRAFKLCPRQYSVRRFRLGNAQIMAGAITSLAAGFAIWNPILAFQSLLALFTLCVLGNSTLRLLAIYTKFTRDRSPEAFGEHKNVVLKSYPVISLLVPLYKEPEMASTLIRNLKRIEYNTDKLDIKLVVEADDCVTISAIATCNLPDHFDVIYVPPNRIRTKPKAMNYALPFCKGEIIGIYDAEDRPDPTQLRRVAEALALADKKTACVQCELAFFNTDQNWFTRCFTMEYRVWFSMLLPALQRFGLAVPLGGTSVFFRSEVLKRVGAWDPYNVTEDADLGVRLKRMGFETMVITSQTLEEANGHGISWIRQRSRWLKGYMMSWLCHARHPIRLIRDLGFGGALGVHVLLLGAVGNYLAIPIFWLCWPMAFSTNILPPEIFSGNLLIMFMGTMIVAQLISLSVGVMALWEKRYRSLLPWWLTMVFYWPLGAAASYKALYEVFVCPYYWDKTKHGKSLEGKNNPPPGEEQPPRRQIKHEKTSEKLARVASL